MRTDGLLNVRTILLSTTANSGIEVADDMNNLVFREKIISLLQFIPEAVFLVGAALGCRAVHTDDAPTPLLPPKLEVQSENPATIG